ncbi:hypothetical protein ACWEIJ_29965 [Lentzea sp. NPDC004789]
MRLRQLSEADAEELLRAVTESLAHLRPWQSWATDDFDASAVAEFLAESARGWAGGTLFNHAITVGGAIVGVVSADRTGRRTSWRSATGCIPRRGGRLRVRARRCAARPDLARRGQHRERWRAAAFRVHRDRPPHAAAPVWTWSGS